MAEDLKLEISSRLEQRIDTQLSVAERAKLRRPDGPAPFLTITRQYGCGAFELAELLAPRLAELEHLPRDSWQVYSRQLIEEISSELHLTEKLVQGLDIHSRSGLEEFFDTWLGSMPSDLTLLRHLVRASRAAALVGHCVLVGHGAPVLTRDLAGGIHLRLIAPEQWRLDSLVSKFGWNYDKAREVLREEEGHRQAFFEKYLDRDVSDPEHYDLILNVGRMSREEQVAAVVALFTKRFHLEPKAHS
jgi:hypothetical protein